MRPSSSRRLIPFCIPRKASRPLTPTLPPLRLRPMFLGQLSSSEPRTRARSQNRNRPTQNQIKPTTHAHTTHSNRLSVSVLAGQVQDACGSSGGSATLAVRAGGVVGVGYASSPDACKRTTTTTAAAAATAPISVLLRPRQCALLLPPLACAPHRARAAVG